MKTIHRPEWEEIDAYHLYRALDFLMDRKPEIEPALYARVRDLFNLKLDLVLWDTTSTYFEGRAAEGLAELGFEGPPARPGPDRDRGAHVPGRLPPGP